MTSHISAQVRQLIADHLPSIERLEILLLLYESREHTWTIEEIEEQIRSQRESVRRHVAALVAYQLVRAESAAGVLYRYAGGTPEADAAVAELAAIYRSRRVSIVQLIYADQPDTVRSFSDAFKIGKPRDR